MGHLYLAELRETDRSLYSNLMQKMENDPILNNVIESYSDKNNYTKEDLLEEAFIYKLQDIHSTDFTNMFLLEGTEQFDGIFDNGSHTIGSITDSFSSLFEDFFGGKFKNDAPLSMSDSLADVMRKIGIDLIFNKNSNLHSMNRNDIDNLKNILKNKKMTETQAIKDLIDRGLMTKDCN
jgi:hypothetical protein